LSADAIRVARESKRVTRRFQISWREHLGRLWEALDRLVKSGKAIESGRLVDADPRLIKFLATSRGMNEFAADPNLVLFRLISHALGAQQLKAIRERTREVKKVPLRVGNPDDETPGSDAVDTEKDFRSVTSPPVDYDSRLHSSRKLSLLCHLDAVLRIVEDVPGESDARASVGLVLLRECAKYLEYRHYARDARAATLPIQGVPRAMFGDWLEALDRDPAVLAFDAERHEVYSPKRSQDGISVRVIESARVLEIMRSIGWECSWSVDGMDQAVSRARRKVKALVEGAKAALESRVAERVEGEPRGT
jgi:hypothetical protein